MYSEECMIDNLYNMFEEENIYTLSEINDNIKTRKCKDIDEAYNELLSYDRPGLYSFTRVNDGSNIWYKLRYVER